MNFKPAVREWWCYRWW